MPLPSFAVTGNLFDLLGNVDGSELSPNHFGSGNGSAKVTFTSNLPANSFVAWDGDLYRVPPVVAEVALDGTIKRNGEAVRLLAEDAGLSVEGLQWTVAVAGMDAVTFDAPADGVTVDLAAVVPVASIEVVENTASLISAAVTVAVNALIGDAPEALNTLNELAAALGDDENFATTVTNAIAAKSRLTVDSVFQSTYNLDTTLPTASELGVYTDGETDAAIIAALLTPIINAILDASGNKELEFLSTASAVNYLQIVNAAAGGAPNFRAVGTDTNVSVFFVPKGSGHFVISVGTGQTPTVRAAGSDTNHNLNLVPKGSGVVQANGVEVVTLTGTQTPTNKTINLSSNTLIATLAQLNAALSDGDVVAANGAITGATKTKVTYDSKGLVTAGADATTADIADSSNKRYVTDAQLTVIGNTSGTNTGDQDLSGLVPNTRTINGEALSANITLNQDEVGDGTTYKQYSQTEKTKLAGIAEGATANDTDANLKNRANHTGTQTASTISDFSTAADARITAASATAATASTLALRDADGNVTADAFISTRASTATSAGTLTMTIADAQTQVLTGSTTHTVKLPTTGVVAGQQYTVANQSSGAVTVQSSGANSIVQLNANKIGVFTAVVDTPTTAAHWIATAPTPSNVPSTVVMRDSNSNLFASNYLVFPASTATSAGTLTMTLASTATQVFTGSTTHTVRLPTTGVNAGQQYTVVNQSSGVVTVQSSDASEVATVAASAVKLFIAFQATPTAAAHWRAFSSD